MSTSPRLVATGVVVLAAGIAGMLFGTVFGVPALLLPVLVPAAAVLVVAVWCGRAPASADWRPLLAAAAGVLAITETALWSTTAAGVPTAETAVALRAGVTESWRLTLQSTWPARPEPALLLFVPLLVVAAAVFGVELLHRLRGPLPALLPSLALLLFAQLYAPLPAWPAVGVALLYAAIAGALLTVGRDDPPRPSRIAVQVAPAVVAAIGVALLVPATPAYSLRQGRAAPVTGAGVTNPLDEIAGRLREPETPVFRFTSGDRVDRWPLIVLDDFDGVNWTPGDPYRLLGGELPPPRTSVRVPLESREAAVTVVDLDGPWLPSQTWPATVDGMDPLVAERHGSLRRQGRDGPARYTLHWWEPRPQLETLLNARVDTTAFGGLDGVGEVPRDISALAEGIAGGQPSSFRTALLLEEFFRGRYTSATRPDLPSGHSWSHLRKFLYTTRRGTSEQFAAAYVVLAREIGIPARMAVGYRTPAAPDPGGGYTVRNGDVLAWPEVAVKDIGWVPLDPSGAASTVTTGGGLAAVAQQARAALPAEGGDPAPAAEPPPATAADGTLRRRMLLAVPALPLAGWLLGVPAAWAVRARYRRRRHGEAAVVAAWAEARDRLRAHGVVASPAMTVRDLAASATTVTGHASAVAVRRLGRVVDRTLWSPTDVENRHVEQAWAAVHAVRDELARRGWRERLRAAYDVRGLRPPREWS